jgi:hypothetical protein
MKNCLLHSILLFFAALIVNSANAQERTETRSADGSIVSQSAVRTVTNLDTDLRSSQDQGENPRHRNADQQDYLQNRDLQNRMDNLNSQTESLSISNDHSSINSDGSLKNDARTIISKEQYNGYPLERRKYIDSNPHLFLIK